MLAVPVTKAPATSSLALHGFFPFGLERSYKLGRRVPPSNKIAAALADAETRVMKLRAH
jgi:hypothetical protein